MSKFIKIGLIIISISIICTGLSLAEDQDRNQDRKKDGSCQIDGVMSDTAIILAADQDRVRDRKKDGSCQTDADQNRKREQKRIGSEQTDAIS